MLKLRRQNSGDADVVLFPALGDGHHQNDPGKVDEFRKVIERLKVAGELVRTSFEGFRELDILVVRLTALTRQILESSSLHFDDGL